MSGCKVLGTDLAATLKKDYNITGESAKKTSQNDQSPLTSSA